MILGHQIRLASNYEQEHYFYRACGVARFTHNWALAEWNRQYESGEKPSGAALKKQFNGIRSNEFPWSQDVHRDCTAQPFANVQKAFQSFFKGETAHPKFHRKGNNDSFYIANDKFRFDKKHNRVRLPVIGWIKIRERLRFVGKIMGAVVKRIADAWFLSVQVEVGEICKERKSHNTVGVDLGITTLATLSTGEKIAGPKALKTDLERLRRLSRRHSRKVKGSSNRKKATTRLARMHRRISDIRNNALHNLTTRLCRENQTVVIEELAVKNMIRNRKLARSIADMGWGEFRRQLTYKAIMYETNIVVADRYFPSSKLCSCCGMKKDELLLSERQYVCANGGCGLVIDRDVNAAINLEKLGQAMAEVTPADKKALALVPSRSRKGKRRKKGETGLGEAGTHSCSLVGT